MREKSTKCSPKQHEKAQNIKAAQQTIPFFLQSSHCGSDSLGESWWAQLNLAGNGIFTIATHAALRPHILIIPLSRLFSLVREEKRQN